MFAGLLRNPCAGIVVLVVIPARFMVGVLLVATGVWLRRRATEARPIGRRRVAGRGLPSCCRQADDAAHHRARRGECRHHFGRGLRHAPLDGISRFLRADLPHPRCSRNTWPGAAHLMRESTASSCHVGEGTAGTRSLETCRSSPARARGDGFDASGRFRRAPRCRQVRKAQTCDGLSPARACVGRSHPRHSRVRRRRGEHGDDDRASDARGRTVDLFTGDSSGTPVPRPRSSDVSSDAERQSIPYVARDRCEWPRRMSAVGPDTSGPPAS